MRREKRVLSAQLVLLLADGSLAKTVVEDVETFCLGRQLRAADALGTRVTTLRAVAVTNSATMVLVPSVGAVGQEEAYEVTR